MLDHGFLRVFCNFIYPMKQFLRSDRRPVHKQWIWPFKLRLHIAIGMQTRLQTGVPTDRRYVYIGQLVRVCIYIISSISYIFDIWYFRKCHDVFQPLLKANNNISLASRDCSLVSLYITCAATETFFVFAQLKSCWSLVFIDKLDQRTVWDSGDTQYSTWSSATRLQAAAK